MTGRTVHVDHRGQRRYGHGSAVGVDEFGQGGDGEGAGSSEQRGFRGIADGDDEPVEACLHPGVQGGQNSRHGSDPAVESDLAAVDDRPGVLARDEVQGLEHGDGDAEVEAGADLRHRARVRLIVRCCVATGAPRKARAARSRLRDSLTEVSGSPTMSIPGRLALMLASIDTIFPLESPQSHGAGAADDVALRLSGAGFPHFRCLGHESTWMFGQWKYWMLGSMMMPSASMRTAGKYSSAAARFRRACGCG